ncbi:hypothetical protein AAE478_002956 [Parahypoxylon ruwenzoriense]
MESDPQSYVLSEDESRVIFERDIIPAELGALASSSPSLPSAEPPASQVISENETSPSRSPSAAAAMAGQNAPLAVLLVGQTGAGKTRTAPLLESAMAQLRNGRPLAHFVADTYKTYHPAYGTLLSTRPALASPATSPDARRWLAMAARYAAQRRADVLLESAARHPGDFADLARAFAEEAGYRVEVVLLAVPKPLSLLGVLARFYESLPEARLRDGFPARLTPRKVHDESYEGLLRAAEFVDADADAEGRAVVDRVVVARRDNLVAYANERDGSGRWKRGGRGAAAAAVRAERERPLTVAERTVAQATLRRLGEIDVPGLKSQLREIEGLLEPLLINADIDTGTYAPLRPLSLLGSVLDERRFDADAGLRLGPVS